MLFVVPDYYEEFSCIAQKCRHNCCIGWEIEIDEETREKYRNTSGETGKWLCENISDEGYSHFILAEGERCPFLNENNLCDIILTLGEENICNICRDHPRFKNELPGRIELGLGLACEEVSRIVLGKKEPVCLRSSENIEETDKIIILRDEIISVIQNRAKTVTERLWEMLKLCGVSGFDIDVAKWAEFFKQLEILDSEWCNRLDEFIRNYEKINFARFDELMHDRQTEYEQFAVYLVYRYFANAPDFEEAALRACFVALCCKLIYALGACFYFKNACFSFEEQVELVRMFSCEIEYCEENVTAVLDELCFCM
ncbi:MAG: flagellin lysine-N-methylase [Oscillospiraceae bacterium]|nr:flagellin lysine-N-methylase [Oscillospiraceae bacterium]